MLKAHFDAIESRLLASAKIPANSGHASNKGTPREAFIKEFLKGHLSERVAIGTGEIIDCDSQPGDRRNQIDIVVYKRDYPRLDFGGGVSGFLAESVVAIIEVKSTLDKDELKKSMIAARNVKALSRRHNIEVVFGEGFDPPGILSYVVAYNGPAKMKTAQGWISDIADDENITFPALPIKAAERRKIASPCIDGIFVLGKGFIHFGNSRYGFFREEWLKVNGNCRWAVVDSTTGSLTLLFLLLTSAISETSDKWFNPMPYLKHYAVPRPSCGD